MRKRLGLIIGISLMVYLPSLFNFFSGDDWFHLRVVEVKTVGEWLNFFSLVRTEQSISFYRPLSTQVFFWAGRLLFGLNSIPYHLVVMVGFAVLLIMISKLLLKLRFDEKTMLIVVLLYGLAASNFTRLYFLSSFQEILMAIGVVGGLISYLEGRNWYWGWFILGLLSKETAIVFGGLVLLVDWYRGKYQPKKYIVIGAISVLYLVLRLGVFGGAGGDSYGWDFSLKRAANTTMWYGLWSIGVPELMVDYVGSGLAILPRFYSDLGWWAGWILGASGLMILTIGLNILATRRIVNKITGLALGWFVLGLLPVVFLPWHKFGLELTLPLLGVVILLGNNLAKNKILAGLFWVSFLGLNLTTNYLTWGRHYSVQRAIIARRVCDYLVVNYPKYPEGKVFRIVNDKPVGVAEWGQSRQVSQAVGGSELWRVIYGDKKIEVEYDDLKPTEGLQAVIELGASQFLKPSHLF